METWRCADEQETREAVAWAAAERAPLRIQGRGTRLGIGRPVAADTLLDLGALTGITLYEPDELVLKARAGTLISEIEAALSGYGQILAFESRDLGPLLGAPAGLSTLGGTVSVGLGGPRRFRQGSVRDFVLGLTAINGQGEIFKSGGRVMKNVTGYDLPKLLTGAYGTLGVLTEITLKLWPAPEEECTVLVLGLDDRNAVAALREALDTPYEVSGAAHLPQAVARRSKVAPLPVLNLSVTALRLEGARAGLLTRKTGLISKLRPSGAHPGFLSGKGGTLLLEGKESKAFWREVADVRYFVGQPGPVWRVSTAPSHGPQIAAGVGAAAWFYDWAGGLLWLLMEPEPHGGASIIRRAVMPAGGHATLMRGAELVRQAVDVFEPEPPALAALSQRVKEAFDPLHVLNPGLIRAEM